MAHGSLDELWAMYLVTFAPGWVLADESDWPGDPSDGLTLRLASPANEGKEEEKDTSSSSPSRPSKGNRA